MEKEILIYKSKALKDLKGVRDVLVGMGDPFLANIIGRAINCIDGQKPVGNAEVVTYCYECSKWDTLNCPMFQSGGRKMSMKTGFCGAGAKK